MRIEWTPEALFDLADLRERISADDPVAAGRVVQTIIRAVEQTLSENSKLGHPGRVPGTRELVVPRTPVIIPYRVRGGRLQILRVYHHARRWPDHF